MDDMPALDLLARLWLGFAGGIAIVTSVAVVAADARPQLPAVLPAALAAAASVAAVVAVGAVDRTFAAAAPADDRQALAEFRRRAFLQVGIAEAPVLFAFVVTFVLGPPWVAVIGAAGGLAALAVARPTARRIDRIEAVWRAAGHDVSILRAAQAPNGGHPVEHPEFDDEEHP